MKKNVRLEDIAKRLNITKVSVSKALRDHDDISLETREKVGLMAKEMGYRPNLQARSLTTKKSLTIGVIVPKLAHSFFSSSIEGIYNSAIENGYNVILGVSYEKEKLEKQHIEAMVNMRVDGLIISVTEQTKNLKNFEIVRDMGIKLVFFDRGIEGAEYSYIKVEDFESARKGVCYLIKKGHHKIAHLAGYRTSHIGNERRLGYLKALQDERIEINEKAVIEGGFSEKDGYSGFEKLINQTDKLDSIFAVTYPVGLGILNYMVDNGIAVDSIPILTFGRSDFNKYLSSPFICIDQPDYELGKKAFEQLQREMKHKHSIEPQIIELSAEVQGS